MGLLARRRGLMSAKAEEWQEVSFLLSSFVASQHTSISISGDSIRVYNTSNYTYRAANAPFSTESGYEYKYVCDATYTSGAGRIAFRDINDSVVPNTSLAAFTETTHIEKTFVSDERITQITLFSTWSTSEKGDVTYSNLKIYRRKIPGEFLAVGNYVLIANIGISQTAPQGCCTDGENIYFAATTSGYGQAQLYKYNLATKTASSLGPVYPNNGHTIGHGSSLCYDPDTGYIYTANVSSDGAVSIVDSSDGSFIDTKYIQRPDGTFGSVYGLALDNIRKCFYCWIDGQSVVNVYDMDFVYQRTINLSYKIDDVMQQSMSTDGTFLYTVMSTPEVVAVYKMDGTLVRTISFDTFNEIESICYDWDSGKWYVMQYNSSGKAAMYDLMMSANKTCDITNASFEVGKNITSSGSISTTGIASYSSAVFALGATVKRTGSATDGDGTALICFLHEYKGTGSTTQSNWLRRTSLSVNSPVTVGADCTNWRLTFAYGSDSGKSMSQSVIDSYFGAEFIVNK